MSEVEFKEEGAGMQNLDPFKKDEVSAFPRWIMKIGLAKTEKGANNVLLAISALILIIAGIIAF